jgi:hypothetical protein
MTKTIIQQLKQHRAFHAAQLGKLDLALKALGAEIPVPFFKGNRRRMSAKARAAIGAAQRKRWAAIRAKKKAQPKM